MNCWHCHTKLIWGGDDDVAASDEYSMVTNLSCPKCGSFVEVYYPIESHKNPHLIEMHERGELL